MHSFHYYVYERVINYEYIIKPAIKSNTKGYRCIYCDNARAKYEKSACSECRSRINTIYYITKYRTQWFVITQLDLINDIKFNIMSIFTRLFNQ